MVYINTFSHIWHFILWLLFLYFYLSKTWFLLLFSPFSMFLRVFQVVCITIFYNVLSVLNYLQLSPMWILIILLGFRFPWILLKFYLAFFFFYTFLPSTLVATYLCFIEDSSFSSYVFVYLTVYQLIDIKLAAIYQ